VCYQSPFLVPVCEYVCGGLAYMYLPMMS